MIAFEEHHNTAAQVQDYLQGALALVRELEPEPELAEACFQKAVDLLAAKTIQCVPTGAQRIAIAQGVGSHG